MDTETIYLIILAIVGCWLISYWVLDNHWFYRALVCVLHTVLFKKNIHILDPTHYYGICWTTDVDIWVFHMNNTKYLRELDFARTDFLVRTRIFQHVRKKKGMVVVGSTYIRYRRFIKVFQIFKISTRIVYWDNNSIYFEHRFITVKDQFVCAIAYVKQRITNFDVEEMMRQFIDKNVVTNENGNTVINKPPIPLEIQKMIDLEEASSAQLKSENLPQAVQVEMT
uniref:Protein THEM6 n=1 Tax=Cacopsylla melanoneura TaxID=428564 RepID=A0A8D9F207_9HEMI